jgi:hypothetical protein
MDCLGEKAAGWQTRQLRMRTEGLLFARLRELTDDEFFMGKKVIKPSLP